LPIIGIGVGSLETSWSSFPNGVNDPGALNVEFDFLSYNAAEVAAWSSLTIHGVSLDTLRSAAQYAGSSIVIKGGMQAGLPLANPEQQGVIMRGGIAQGYGNWVGTEQTLDFLIDGNYKYTHRNPGNIVLNCLPGQDLVGALVACVSVAFPGLHISPPQVSGEYIFSWPLVGPYPTLKSLSRMVQSLTAQYNPPGISVTIRPDNTILISDGTPSGQPKQISFTDLVGQPTWIDSGIMQFTTIMRADIQVGDYVIMPAGLTTTPGQVTVPTPSNGPIQYQTTFNGPYHVIAIRQVGNFRDPNGTSWVTIFQAAQPPSTF
jgi:hypothetical protein